jgi:hypothetical protein
LDLTTLEHFQKMQFKMKIIQRKLTMPILAVGAGYIPAFGGDVTINYALYGMQRLAQNVTGVKVPLSGHWIPEERPDFVVTMLNDFFGGANIRK